MFGHSASAIDFADRFGDEAETELASGQLSFETFWHLLWAWSKKTFGPRYLRGPVGPIRHLAKEVVEAESAAAEMLRTAARTADGVHYRAMPEHPAAVSEFHEEVADMLFLVFDAAWRGGMTLVDLKRAVAAKLVKNRSRKWGPPSADQPTEHVRDGETPP